MSVNLIKTIQENLGFAPLKKIDPNTQQETGETNNVAENKFSQAAIPAVLAGLYRYVQSDEGAAEVLSIKSSDNWIANIFGDNRNEAVEKVAVYAQQPNEDTVVKMNAIVNEAVKVAKENLPLNAGMKELKDFFSGQVNNILPYLPVELNMGELLQDNTLDDNTNKMEGPISSLIKNIGAAFSSPVTGEELKENNN